MWQATFTIQASCHKGRATALSVVELRVLSSLSYAPVHSSFGEPQQSICRRTKTELTSTSPIRKLAVDFKKRRLTLQHVFALFHGRFTEEDAGQA